MWRLERLSKARLDVMAQCSMECNIIRPGAREEEPQSSPPWPVLPAITSITSITAKPLLFGWDSRTTWRVIRYHKLGWEMTISVECFAGMTVFDSELRFLFSGRSLVFLREALVNIGISFQYISAGDWLSASESFLQHWIPFRYNTINHTDNADLV